MGPNGFTNLMRIAHYGRLANVFRSTWRFDSKADLLSCLTKNVVYMDPNPKNDLVVINKPYGVPVHPAKDSPVCLQDVLQDLADFLQVPKLQTVSCASRFTSGCSLLCTQDDTLNRLRKCKARSRHQSLLSKKFLMVTLGHPTQHDVTEKVVMQLLPVPGKLNFHGKTLLEPVISRAPVSRTRLKRDQAVIALGARWSTLSRSGVGRCGLASLEMNTTRHNAALAYAADQLSPVLGDQFFSYRVRNVQGVPSKVSHEHSPGHPQPQSLPPFTMEALKLTKWDVQHIPCHLHLFRWCLSQYFGHGRDLVVYAPPPDFFLSTLRQLKIDFDFEALKQSDSLTYYVSEKQKAMRQEAALEQD